MIHIRSEILKTAECVQVRLWGLVCKGKVKVDRSVRVVCVCVCVCVCVTRECGAGV